MNMGWQVAKEGIYRDEDAGNAANHAWPIIDDKVKVDITGSQFKKSIYIYENMTALQSMKIIGGIRGEYNVGKLKQLIDSVGLGSTGN